MKIQIHGHIVIKFQNVKDEKEMLNTAKEEKKITQIFRIQNDIRCKNQRWNLEDNTGTL